MLEHFLRNALVPAPVALHVLEEQDVLLDTRDSMFGRRHDWITWNEFRDLVVRRLREEDRRNRVALQAAVEQRQTAPATAAAPDERVVRRRTMDGEVVDRMHAAVEQRQTAPATAAAPDEPVPVHSEVRMVPLLIHPDIAEWMAGLASGSD